MSGRKIIELAVKVCAATLLMCIVVFHFNALIFDPTVSFLVGMLALLACIGAGVLTFGLAAHWMKNDELTFLLSMREKPKIPKSE